jgi:hypothetical protein
VHGVLTAVAGPQPQDLPPALGGDGQGGTDGPAGHRAVTDLHVDGVDEDHRTDGAEGPALPFGHAFEGLAGDGGDGPAGDPSAMDLSQVGLHLTGGQALRSQRDDRLADAGQALLPLLDNLRFVRRNGRGRGATTISTGPASVSTVLERLPLRESPPFLPAASCAS